MKSLSLYRQQIAGLQTKQTEILIDMAQVVAEAMADGYKPDEILTGQEHSPKQPEFLDL